MGSTLAWSNDSQETTSVKVSSTRQRLHIQTIHTYTNHIYLISLAILLLIFNNMYIGPIHSGLCRQNSQLEQIKGTQTPVTN